MFQWNKAPITTNVGKGKKTGYVARIHVPGMTSQKDIIRRLAYAMSIEEADAALFVDEFANQLAEAMTSGQNVKLEGFGTFMLSAKTKSAASADEVSADNIQKLNVNFRIDTEFKKQLSKVKMVYAKDVQIKHV